MSPTTGMSTLYVYSIFAKKKNKIKMFCCFVLCFLYVLLVLDIFLVQPLTDSSTVQSHIINIGEIEAYDVNGDKLTLTIDSYSSENTIEPISYTIDGDPSTFGHTFNSPTDLNVYNWFKYSILGLSDICSLERITVYNREDSCCKYRIVGNYLQILENSLAINTFYFDEEKDIYNFTFLCNETGMCVSLIDGFFFCLFFLILKFF